MNRRLTLDRFLVAWTTAGGDDLPFPLHYRTTAMWEDEHVAHLRAARAWHRESPDPALEHAVRTLLTGEVAVEIYGRSADPANDVFARAAMAGDRAVLVRQDPLARDIHLTTTTTALIAEAMLDLLPAVAAGREPARVAAGREVLEPSATGSVRRSAGDTGAESIRRLLHRERSATGSIRILTYSDPGHAPVTDIGWFDVVDDGRYLFLPGPDISVVPGTTEAFRRELSTQVHRLRGVPRTQRRGVMRPH
ncbi:ESX secretion-associated protein EspG [Rhodococcus sp. CH91]|uniref:ESX secretion-associated protein EspG n=1 Tax=Rhodococcus sp. CH91 TaxID=2910256 RepID=UPI001F4A258C|nr:ESX secretion-associated protein EspG [Rhodococcus sp. CH91]